MSSAAETAVSFARDVYRELLRPPLPDGWSIFLDCPGSLQNNGYFGAAYIQVKGSSSIVYIAHRGTANLPDVVEDIEMWVKSVVPIQFYTGAIPFIQLVFNKLDALYPYPASKQKVHIRFTGHSLGATLAELSELKYIHYFNDKTLSTYNPNRSMDNIDLFESPGSEPLVLQMLNAGETTPENIEDAGAKIQLYNSDINAINTCMRSLAVLSGSSSNIIITAMGYEYSSLSPPKEPLPFVPGAKYFFWNYTIRDQHKIDYVYQWVFHQTAAYEYIHVKDWPVGIDKAYIAYISYYDLYSGDIEMHNHNSYWKLYTECLWNQDPALHSTYRTLNEFRQDYYHNELIYIYSANKVNDLSIQGEKGNAMLSCEQQAIAAEVKNLRSCCGFFKMVEGVQKNVIAMAETVREAATEASQELSRYQKQSSFFSTVANFLDGDEAKVLSLATTPSLGPKTG